MTPWERFWDQIPLLLVATPLLGLVSLVLLRRIDRDGGQRTLGVNLMLSVCLLSILIAGFERGPDRTRLSASDSFQSVSRFVLTFGEAKNADSNGVLFGVDGVALTMLLIAVISPWITWKSLPKDTPALVLSAQGLVFLTLLSLDLRVVMLAPFLLQAVLSWRDASLSSTAAIKSSWNWQRQVLLSNALLAAGFFYLIQICTRYMSKEPAKTIVQLQELFLRLELLRDDDPERAGMLAISLTPAIWLIVAGCLFRFSLFPFHRASLHAAPIFDARGRVLACVQGPILGAYFLLRIWQIAPQTTAELLLWIQPLAVWGYLWLSLKKEPSAIHIRMAATHLVFAGLSTPNSTSFAGALLLLCVSPGFEFISYQRRSLDRYWLWPVSLAILLIALGLFQGTGSGARNFLEPILVLAGSGLFLLNRVHGKTENASRLFSQIQIRSEEPVREYPVWSVANLSRPAIEVSRTGIVRKTLLAVAFVCLVFFPQFFWNLIRWDLQKIEFPRSSAAFSARIDPVPTSFEGGPR